MRIVLTHLTRMDAPRICIAGIDPDTGHHIRPTTGRSNPLTRAFLAEEHRPFALGALVELGETKPNPNPPEVEDHLFWPERARVLGRLSPQRYLDLLRVNAQHNLQAIFGRELQRQNRTYAVDKGRGTASLGVLRAQRKPDIRIDHYGKLRLQLQRAGESPAYLPVTDMRFVEPDHKTIRQDVLADVKTRMKHGIEVYLMLGLTRAFLKDGDDRERHWLQVNGICMADRPLGERP
jgi:hypothetical protein